MEIAKRVEGEALFLLRYKTTVRCVAKQFGVSKSTVHFDLSKRLKIINFDLFERVDEVLKDNFKQKHLRGGLSTKIKYSNCYKKV